MGALTAVGVLSTLVGILAGVIYQTQLHRVVVNGFGIGRAVQPISDFSEYQCRKIVDPRLQACEDMWLSEATRQLFFACSDSKARTEWLPQMERYKVEARSQRDAIVAVDIDKPNGDSFEYRALKTPGFKGTNGDGNLYLTGFAGNDDLNGDIRFWVINSRPAVNYTTGEFLEPSVYGLNSTIELFRYSESQGQRSDVLEHEWTWFHPNITTPNRIAPRIIEDKPDFWFTNDHGPHKTGLKHKLSPYIGTGDVSMCRRKACWPVAKNIQYPNGLVKGQDGLIYVPSSFLGTIDVYEHVPNKGLNKLETIETGYSLDNLMVDKNGDIYAAAFPRGLKFLQGFEDVMNARPPATALKITKQDGKYQVVKAIEDANGEVLPASTSVVHDATTGRLFFSGVYAPFIAVCDRKAQFPNV